jgi:hypothetical protein
MMRENPPKVNNGLYFKQPIEIEWHRDRHGAKICDAASADCPYCGEIVYFEYDPEGIGPHKSTDCMHIVDNDGDFAVFLGEMTPELWAFHKILTTDGRAILPNLPAVYSVGHNPLKASTYMVRRAYNGGFDHVYGYDDGHRFMSKHQAAWYCVEDAVQLLRRVGEGVV